MKQSRTYINLIRNFYQFGISSELGPLASLLFQSLLYKANELYFPETIKISSKELCSLSGNMSYHSMWQARDILKKYQFNDSWLIQLSKGEKTKNTLAEFRINYAILLRSQNNDRIITEEPQNNDRITTDAKVNYRSVDVLPLVCDDSQNDDIGIHSKIRSDQTKQDIRSDQTPPLTPYVNLNVIPEKEKEPDDLLNLSEAERKLLERLETYLNATCMSKWKEGIHCEKYPDRQYRILIVKNCKGMYPFVKNAIDGKILEVEKESLFDEFLYKSILQSLKEGVDYYGK